jgi:hypothetical protein
MLRIFFLKKKTREMKLKKTKTAAYFSFVRSFYFFRRVKLKYSLFCFFARVSSLLSDLKDLNELFLRKTGEHENICLCHVKIFVVS